MKEIFAEYTLKDLIASLYELKELIISNIIMLGEIPSSSGNEFKRIQKFIEIVSRYGVIDVSMDEKGNGYCVINGASEQKNIVLTTNADTFVPSNVPYSMQVDKDVIVGPFVGDNSPALGVLATLPFIMEKLNIKLKSNVMIVAAANNLGSGNLSGIRYFLDNFTKPIHYGLCVESVQLGRLNHISLGTVRGEITVTVPKKYNWAQFGVCGSIVPMNDIISAINRIPLPRRPITSIVLGAIHGGVTHQTVARQTTLLFEIRSEDSQQISIIRKQFEEIVMDVAAKTGMDIKLNAIAERNPGGIEISHPLVRIARQILEKIGVEPMIYPTTSMLSAFIEKNIPSITIGLTKGGHIKEVNEVEESIEIVPLYSGILQLIGLLFAIDEM